MARTIDSVKKKLSEAFLGRGGVHAIGIRRPQNAIVLYLHAPASAERDRVIEEARRAAAPFAVVVVEEGSPTAGA